MYRDRIRHAALESRIMSASEAAKLLETGMTVGLSGFTKAGDCKAMPGALAQRAREDGLQLTIATGASLGNDSDGMMAESGLIARRMPFQGDARLRRGINRCQIMFMDQPLSETVEQFRGGPLAPIDVAIVEAEAINDDGSIIPTNSVGNTASFVAQAKKVIIELNLAMPLALEGLHDIYIPGDRPQRQPIPLTAVSQRIGTPAIPLDPERIAAIVLTDSMDSPSSNLPPDSETQAIARHVVDFFSSEVAAGRLKPSLLPLQAGIGTIANAVMHGLLESSFSLLACF